MNKLQASFPPFADRPAALQNRAQQPREKAAALGRCFIELTARLAEASAGRLVAIDGKTLRGSFDRAHRELPTHLVHAWDHANAPPALR